MVSFQKARAHAAQCGIVLHAGIDAVPVESIVSRSKSGRGAWLAADVIHPETMKVVYPTGYWLDSADIPILQGMGVDYVILEN